MGYKSLELHNMNNALNYFNNALEIESDNPKALTGLGLGLNMGNEFERSLKCFNQVLKTNPTNKNALNGKDILIGRYRSRLSKK